MRKTEAAQILSRMLRHCRLAREAESIWDDYPSLRNVALKLCWYLSPYIECGGENLLASTLKKAIDDFQADAGDNRARAFLAAVQAGAVALCAVRVSARECEAGWLVWECEEPLMDWIEAIGANAVQVIFREEPLKAGPIVVRMMGQVCTIRDLRVAGLSVGASN